VQNRFLRELAQAHVSTDRATIRREDEWINGRSVALYTATFTTHLNVG
jgi:hypothetical protein